MAHTVADFETRPVSRLPDDRLRRQAFEEVWALLRPAVADFDDAEIGFIRNFLSRSILAAMEEGETHRGQLGVSALRKLCVRLRTPSGLDCQLN